jgi:hypothetical protein
MLGSKLMIVQAAAIVVVLFLLALVAGMLNRFKIRQQNSGVVRQRINSDMAQS